MDSLPSCIRTLLLLLLTFGAGSAGVPSSSAATLTAAPTLRPNMGLYKPGEAVSFKFNATGVTVGQTLTMTIQDAMGTVVKTQTFNVTTQPNWTVTATGYNAKLGFYRVYGTLSGGTVISALGSRPAGFITYAIVPDPAQRPALSEYEAFYGIQGGVNQAVGTDIHAFMGWRWAIEGNWNWTKVAPTYGGAFVTPTTKSYAWATNGAGGPWVMHNLPNLTKDGRPYGGTPDVYKPGTFKYNTGALQPAYHADWQNFCGEVATKWPALYANRSQPIYEVTWEPVYPWGYLGTPEDLVTLYQLAYNKISAVSSTALVAGPCMSVNTLADLAQQYTLFDLGLGNYIDVFTAHPYMECDIVTSANPFKEPELAGQPCLIRTMKRKLREYIGTDIPMIGTEQGYRTRQDTAREIFQAQRLTRSNLLVLGEGWRANTAFYFADYWYKDTIEDPDVHYWDWGFFYNLDTPSYDGYSPAKVSPKPIAAAYAALTFLTEGRHSVCDINWLGATTRGYALQKYSDPNDVLLALWNFGSTGGTVTINTGASSIEHYDMWGNKTVMPTTGGNVTLALSKSPVYIKGVAASQWGSARPDRNVARGKAVTVSSTESASYPGGLAVDGDSVSYLSRWKSVSDMAPSKWIAINLGASYSINEIRFWTGDYFPGSNNNTYNTPLSDYQLQYWNGSNWTTVINRTGNTKPVVVETFPAVTTSQVRLYVPTWKVTQARLYEIEVLAAEATSPTGTILREYWTGISGASVSHLTGNANYPGNPSGSGSLAIFEAPTSFGDNYGQRVRGYVHPPVTGTYVFWIAADDNAELWLSTDSNPANKVRIARVPGYTSSRQWTKYPEQQSGGIPLAAGQRYYIEALHKEGGGGDNLAVGWQLPSGTLERPIPGSRLSP